MIARALRLTPPCVVFAACRCAALRYSTAGRPANDHLSILFPPPPARRSPRHCRCRAALRGYSALAPALAARGYSLRRHAGRRVAAAVGRRQGYAAGHIPSGQASVASHHFARVQPQPGAMHSPRPRLPPGRQCGQAAQIAPRALRVARLAIGRPAAFQRASARRRLRSFWAAGEGAGAASPASTARRWARARAMRAEVTTRRSESEPRNLLRSPDSSVSLCRTQA